MHYIAVYRNAARSLDKGNKEYFVLRGPNLWRENDLKKKWNSFVQKVSCYTLYVDLRELGLMKQKYNTYTKKVFTVVDASPLFSQMDYDTFVWL